MLDLFSGSGALGLEALSRGATEAVFVEMGKEALSALRRNALHSRLEGARILAGDVFDLWTQLMTDGPFDLVFADPPYGNGLLDRMFALPGWERLLQDDGRVIAEHDAREEISPGSLVRIDERIYGRNAMTFYRRRHN